MTMKRQSSHKLRRGRVERLCYLPPNLQTVGAVSFSAQDFASWTPGSPRRDGQPIAWMLRCWRAISSPCSRGPLSFRPCAWLPSVWGIAAGKWPRRSRARRIRGVSCGWSLIIPGIGAPADYVASRSNVRVGARRALRVGTIFCGRRLGDRLYDRAAPKLYGLTIEVRRRCGRR